MREGEREREREVRCTSSPIRLGLHATVYLSCMRFLSVQRPNCLSVSLPRAADSSAYDRTLQHVVCFSSTHYSRVGSCSNKQRGAEKTAKELERIALVAEVTLEWDSSRHGTARFKTHLSQLSVYACGVLSALACTSLARELTDR